jgi:hypothetical protein
MPFGHAENTHLIQWNVSIQQEVLPQTALSFGYAGSRGLNLTKIVWCNAGQVDEIGGRLVFPADAERANPNFSLDLQGREWSGNSWYNSFQQGFHFQASYYLQQDAR